jgi:DNA repair protein RecN (Recombination protein N)
MLTRSKGFTTSDGLSIKMRLRKLSVNNLAIIEKLEVSFEKGLNIITGETGAGKSIIISALSLILGKKADPDMIRTGEEKLTVEAEFEDSADRLIVRREYFRNKKNRFFINDSPAVIEAVTYACAGLIDIHGQHDHQSLLDKNSHINILDERSGISGAEMSSLFAESLRIKKEIERITVSEKELKDKRELLEYHLKEINEVSPSENEESEVSLKLKKMENIEDIKKICSAVSDSTDSSEDSLLSKLRFITAKCSQLSEIDKQFEPFIKDLDSAYQAVKEFSDSTAYFSAVLEFDEDEYNRLSDRYSVLRKLMKKFGPNLDNVIKYRDDSKKQLDSIENISFDREKLEKNLKELSMAMQKESTRLSGLRKEGKKLLEKEINAEFSEIGLGKAEMSVVIAEKEISPDGKDSVEFYISTNAGEDAKPLSKIASGGEISRVMLSIKNVLHSEKGVGIAVFDEIDSGISGSVAEKVGKKLLKLSQTKQVIVITHLPSIASKGETHFSVRKRTVKDRTFVEVVRLNKDQRIEEIASLITTEKAGDDSKKLAAKMLET